MTDRLAQPQDRWWTCDPNEGNDVAAAAAAIGLPLVGLVDEDAGGIVGYLSVPHADAIAAKLNEAALTDDEQQPQKRLEELRQVLRAECISYGELAELESLAEHIEPGDVELLEAAGLPEFPDDGEPSEAELTRGKLPPDLTPTTKGELID